MRADRPNFWSRVERVSRDSQPYSGSMATKGSDMSTSAPVADWIKRIADDERRRDTVRAREGEIVARKADLVRLNGRRLIDELRTTVTRDVDAFRNEFAGDGTRDIVVETTAANAGFVVRKPAPAAV